MLKAKDLIGEIQERAREQRKKALKKANRNNPNHKNNGFGSAELKPSKTDNLQKDKSSISEKPKTNQHSTPVHENKELAELASVIITTVISRVQVWTLLIQMIV
ncbi:hypothetical protein MTR00_09155 [Staphylococcus agnetis]|uniref:hypothetical protein n=1 Tax=Staphylococcus agnetis TaxID=985762 RepID=UPI00208FE7D1|nr:hypothetical protein [Staphylococcus agnetis]MCO4327564.1 hypothetical protein [Staphylococcus agnetis]MCO4369932.1 hypothetical protein [Staphylococcus agnetis]